VPTAEAHGRAELSAHNHAEQSASNAVVRGGCDNASVSEPSKTANTWRAILDGAPDARRGDPPILRAAFEHPVLSRLYPTHGTLKFYRTPPSSLPADQSEELPFVVCGGPPYKIYAAGYARLIGEADTPTAAVAILAAAVSDADTPH
jgi:Family of unknown function (DUF6193)